MPFKINPFSNRLDEVADGGSDPDIPTSFVTDDGIAVPAAHTLLIRAAPIASGSSVKFTGSTNQVVLHLSDDSDNVFIGRAAGNLVGASVGSVGLGVGALQNFTASQNNTAVGFTSLNNVTDGTQNTGVGYMCLSSGTSFGGNTGIGSDCLAACTGDFNCGMGWQTLKNLISGTGNTVLGNSTGFNYTGAESNNILINHIGVTGESGTTRIGTSGDTTSCFIAGITGVSITGGATTLCDSNGQLGTVVSSVRYKENIEDIPETISILDLKPVQFNYKSDENKTKIYGFIAEEVEKIRPDLCLYGLDGQVESVKYHETPALLLKEIQRLNQRIDVLYDLILDDSVA